MKDALGDRMKQNYERAFLSYLPYRMPVVIRLDGKSFHTFTRDTSKPFDNNFMSSMNLLTQKLCRELQTARFAYSQSDEVSVLLHPYQKLTSQPWFGNEIQKMVSVAAGYASSWFSLYWQKEAVFDARCFVLPEAEVNNYFIWRQKDATRNSISMLAQSLFSHKALQGKSTEEMKEMCLASGSDWEELSLRKKRGMAVYKDDAGIWKLDKDIPDFVQDKTFVERWLSTEEE